MQLGRLLVVLVKYLSFNIAIALLNLWLALVLISLMPNPPGDATLRLFTNGTLIFHAATVAAIYLEKASGLPPIRVLSETRFLLVAPILILGICMGVYSLHIYNEISAMPGAKANAIVFNGGSSMTFSIVAAACANLYGLAVQMLEPQRPGS